MCKLLWRRLPVDQVVDSGNQRLWRTMSALRWGIHMSKLLFPVIPVDFFL
jgi:hypothetical protein